ncbi:MAG TPA: GntR family transcriptional regulator [Ruminococcaceae bacterium]|nr:GntR family transcriptional regulator [Oscillospiraceae bacterium]
MQPEFSQSAPIYVQLMDISKRNIIRGEWRAGEKMPPVRDLAVKFGVNPNTVQRALSELEREGLVYSERTAGRFITKDVGAITALKDKTAKEYIQNFLGHMKQLGFNKEQLIKLIKEEDYNE